MRELLVFLCMFNMALKSVLPETLGSKVKEIAKLHAIYLNAKNVQDNVKYLRIEITEDIIHRLNYFNKELGNILKILSKERLEEIIKNFEDIISENTLGLLVYDFVLNMYEKTDDFERMFYFRSSFETYIDDLHLLVPNMMQEQTGKLTNNILPYIKLEAVIKIMQEGNIPLTSSLVQLFECIKCPKLLREDCYQIMFNKIGSKNCEVIKFELNPLVEGFGFLGDHYKLKITIKPNEEISCFAKFIPSTNQMCEELALKAFKKEQFVYLEFIPLLKKSGIEDLSNFAPKCYFSKTNDVIVLEDLSPMGFICSEITKPTSYEWMVVVTKLLSKFHCSSIVLDEKLSEQIGKQTNMGEVFSKYLEEINMDKRDPNCWFMYFGGKLISDYFIEKLSYICKKLPIEKLKQATTRKVEKVFEHVKKSKKYYNVICHGDIWGGNILMNSHLDCIFIDYQLIRYCPPIVDLLFMIYMNSDREFRLKYLDEILEIYYKNLQHNLEMYNIDVAKFYTRELFFESVTDFKSTGIIQALMYLQIMLCPREIIKNVNSNEEKAKKFYAEDRLDIFDAVWSYEPFKTRITGLIEELYEVCEKENIGMIK